MSSPANPILEGPSGSTQNDEYSLAALSMAAEYSALHGDFTAASPFQRQSIPQGPAVPLLNDQLATPVDSLQGPYTNQSQGLGFEDPLDGLASFLDNDLLSSYHFSSLISTEQPMVYKKQLIYIETMINLKSKIPSHALDHDYLLYNPKKKQPRLNSKNR